MSPGLCLLGGDLVGEQLQSRRDGLPPGVAQRDPRAPGAGAPLGGEPGEVAHVCGITG
jgi:hypothetical protein